MELKLQNELLVEVQILKNNIEQLKKEVKEIKDNVSKLTIRKDSYEC